MKNRKRICINAANLHVGGGVQVATSFLSELAIDATKIIRNYDLTILISTAVRQNLGELKYTKLANQINVVEQNIYGIQPVYDVRFRRELKAFDIIFTIFGPDYLPFTKAKRIVGFAQPWIIYPKNEVYPKLSFFNRIKTRILFKVQELFFRASDYWVVELEHVKDRLCELGISAPDKVWVAYNCASQLYRETAEHARELPRVKDRFKLGIISRDYPHKNLSIIPDFVENLERKTGCKIEFYVTLTPEEWNARDERFKESVTNVGSLTVDQCITFYRNIDGVLFPSLLECFSATPLEALSMCRPLFASDKPFNRNVCKSFAYYFDPNSLDSMVACVGDYILNIWGNDHERLLEARDYALDFSSSEQRAGRYIEILNKVIEE